MKKHLDISIYGKVQGIFFRASAKEQAEKLGIFGFAKNMPDGSVYIEAEGEQDKLEQFKKWCHTGPSMAQVTKLEVTEKDIKNFSEFEVF